MRKLLFVVLALTGCDEASLELSATIQSVAFAADPEQADALATIDLTVDLEATAGEAEVRLDRVTAFALPRDDGAGVNVAGVLMNPQGQGNEVVRLGSGEIITVRVTNGDVVNDVVAPWCERPAQVEVAFAGEGKTAQDAADVTVLCR